MCHVCIFIQKHLLSTYYLLNTEFGPGRAKVTETGLAPAPTALIISEGRPVFQECKKYHKQPCLDWLSGLSAGLRTKGLQV